MVRGVLSEGGEVIGLNLGRPEAIVPNPFPESPGVLRTDVGIGVEWWGPDGIGNGRWRGAKRRSFVCIKNYKYLLITINIYKYLYDFRTIGGWLIVVG